MLYNTTLIYIVKFGKKIFNSIKKIILELRKLWHILLNKKTKKKFVSSQLSSTLESTIV